MNCRSICRRLCWAFLAVLVVIGTSACRSTDAARSGADGSAPDAAPSSASANAPSSASPQQSAGQQSAEDSSASIARLERLYWEQQREDRSEFTEADVRFMNMMITHHAQALVMSALAPTHGASEQVRVLASRITNAQRDEINTMQRWLRVRDQPVPSIDIEGTALRVDGKMVHGMDMAGILTQAQIDSLDAARGTTFDRLFLTFMIEHHRGAVSMVDRLFGADGAASDDAAFRLASDINADQSTEIARMRRMLESLPPGEGAP